MNDLIPDALHRQLALNPQQSFIVQAPAGSGKTELLTQRFLVLLSQVHAPEEILAITFTKKSAAEMRARIIHALKQACLTPVTELSAHLQKTWNLAQQVIQRDKQLNWNLLQNPNRLRIQTIDSFNVSLTKQLPILSQFGATPEISDDSFELYQETIQEFLSHLEENLDWSDAIAHLLVHMDNDLNQVQALLINMLAKRDQWLPAITTNLKHPTLRAQLENHLIEISQELLKEIADIFPNELTNQLLPIARFAAQQLKLIKSTSLITHLENLTQLPSCKLTDKKSWLALAELFMTQDSTWRKRVDKNLGFPAASQANNSSEKNLFISMKEGISTIIEKLNSNEPLRRALQELRLAPAQGYSDTQWQTLNALHQVLLVAVAQLKLVFQQHGKIDYIENSQAALLALGTDEHPTDIALALDYQIRHILVDEFQDTSHNQYRLLEKLTMGWEPHDGRTLFLVGDPMQSIYRFREAEVGLFIRSRKQGINQIKLNALTLSVNFRSTATIVNWINQCFSEVFPKFDDIATGAVSYSPSIANQNQVNQHAYVNVQAVFNSNQAEQIVKLIQRLKVENPKQTIAILVRSRTHLQDIIPALKAQSLSFKAIDIDPLTARPVIQDLIALTRALSHPADRIAWLAILRAPWCGFSLSDLLALASEHPSQSIIERLLDKNVISEFSPLGKQQIARVLPILQQKLAERGRYKLSTWVESCWILLGGPACLTDATDLEDAQAFFKLLEKLDHSGDLSQIEYINRYVSKLYAAPNHQVDDSLQIMTVHNAKGLEFDAVILPHLERKSAQDEKQLLLWMERSTAHESSSLLIAPIHAIGDDNDSIYEYIKRQHAIKADYESSRLLYVAATRAKSQLHLFFDLEDHDIKDYKPVSGSLLSKLWPIVQTNIDNHPVASIDLTAALPSRATKYIKRLTATWTHPLQTISDSIAYHNENPGFYLADTRPKLIGIIIHQILQKIALSGMHWWQKKSVQQCHDYLKTKLIHQYFPESEITSACELVYQAIQRSLADTRGQWILSKHVQAQSEYSLTATMENKIKTFIIDRTFVENGIRWIIDYKTTFYSGEQIEHFLDEEQQRYQKQMAQYAEVMQRLENSPIRLGLYFPLLAAWREWSPKEVINVTAGHEAGVVS